MTGVDLPSETMCSLGVAVTEDVEALKRSRSVLPEPITHDEDGNRLPTVRPIRSQAVLEGDEEELMLVDVDD